VVERILHNLSLLLNQSFKTVQELNRYRKEIGKELADSIVAKPSPAGA